MKPLSAILAFIGLTVLGMLIAGCFVKKSARLNNVMYCLEIGDPTTNTYVELIDGVQVGEPKLKKKLKEVKDKKGKCEITFLVDNGTPDSTYCDKITLKTDRVIKSELASNRGRDTSAANDPNLMNRVSSQDPKDIADIAALLKP